MKSRISFSGTGGKKHSKNTAPFPPSETEKTKQRFLDPNERGKSNDIAHASIIQVFTVDELGLKCFLLPLSPELGPHGFDVLGFMIIGYVFFLSIFLIPLQCFNFIRHSYFLVRGIRYSRR